MSINHYYSSSSSSDNNLPEPAQWWSSQYMNNNNNMDKNNFNNPNTAATFWAAAATPYPHHHLFHHHPHNNAFTFNLNNNNEEEEHQSLTNDVEAEKSNITVEKEIPKEPLFEKPLTPSDVGKLNRLVIPKQHAEKYFPLNGGAGGDSGEKGLLLGFEDEVGKSWRFRYSYWNSSQSYVLTKGWSRFVKEKKLDAGDVVQFGRHRVDAGRLFIGWRRRNSGQDCGGGGVAQPVANGGGGRWGRVVYSGYTYPSQQYHQGPSSTPYQPDSLTAGTVVQNQQTTVASGNPKMVRLFGVNLECHTDESEPSTPDGSPMSSQGQAYHHPYHHHQYYSNNHMDTSFSGGSDVYRQG